MERSCPVAIPVGLNQAKAKKNDIAHSDGSSCLHERKDV
ncbi:hypothetical protein LEP1GSC125_0987 [Leptospira mayottensis 200901122]|uniref:Uncharacterized protein n=1 Tax=Leptospira mayottensis 200901122 TaxID=1193010 RepID=A0AA87MJH6_9LEPT|nr:hypothetical protein LEP1GSC125_0987 [Leptospira mayottensis 200901122]